MQFVTISPPLRSKYQDKITALEDLALYPLGSDSFKINHGSDYFAFFERLGKVLYLAVLDEEKIVAVAAGVLRTRPIRAWYLCDLKVHPDYRGRHLPLKMLSRVFILNYLKCRRGYAISMNQGGQDNRIAKMLSKFFLAPFKVACTLEIFSMDACAMQSVELIVEAQRGAMGYLSLSGIKDIVLSSTSQPMPILHVQFGPSGEISHVKPQPGCLHMLCSPAGDILNSELNKAGIFPTGTATVIQHGLKNADWRFILTSEI